MNILEVEKVLVEFAEKHSLKEKALTYCVETFEASIKSDKEIGVDFLNGYIKEELIFEFDRHELHFMRDIGKSIIRTRIGLYIKDIKGIWFSNIEPVGYYELEVNLEGEILDDYLILEKEKNKS